MEYKKGDIVLAPCDFEEIAYFKIQKGLARSYVVSDTGNELTVHIFGEGTVFPLLNYFTKKRNLSFFEILSKTATLEKLTKKTIDLQTSADTLELLNEVQKFANATYGLQKRIALLAEYSTPKRIEQSIKYLTEKYPDVEFTHREIAAFAGVSRESVSRFVGASGGK